MKKVVVIGSGVFGTWTALLTRRAGYETELVDARGPANERSSSAGESRIIRLAYGADELYTRFAARSLEMWKRFFADRNCPDCYHRTGALWMANRRDATLDDVGLIFERLGVRFDLLDAAGLRRRYPQMSVHENTGGILEPESGALAAEKSVKAVFAACADEGVCYRQLTVLPPAGGSVLRALETVEGERIEADTFVFASGPWLPRLFPAVLGDRIFPTRQELFFFARPHDDDRFGPAGMPVWIDETEEKIAYGFPDLDGAGCKIAFHELGPSFDPETGDREVTAEQIEEAASYLGNRFPAMRGAALRSVRVCPYENTSSGDFLIDRHPEWSNVWLVGGGSGHGFKHGPAVAEYLVGVLNGECEPEPRFSLRTKMASLNREVV